jgi:uncharacterized membrane protein
MTHTRGADRKTGWYHLAAIFLFLIVLPLTVLLYAGAHPGFLIPAIVSTFLFQAAAVGLVSLGNDPALGFLTIASIGIAFILIEFEFLIALSARSRKVAAFIRAVEKKARKLRFIERYGAYTLIPLMWIPGIGLYGGVIIGWLFGWDQRKVLALLVTGWLIACFVVLLLVTGIVNIFFT